MDGLLPHSNGPVAESFGQPDNTASVPESGRQRVVEAAISELVVICKQMMQNILANGNEIIRLYEIINQLQARITELAPTDRQPTKEE